MAQTLQQVQKKAMALKAKEVQAKIEMATQFGQPMLMGATDDVTGEEGNDPVGMADGGLIGKARASLGGRAKQLEEQEAKALAPQKEVKPMPKVEKKPEEKPRSFLETAKKAVFGFKDGGRVNCGDGGLIRGPGTGTSDSIKAKGPGGADIRVSDKEFILPADTTEAIGPENLQAIVDATHTPVKPKFGNGFVNGRPPLELLPLEPELPALEYKPDPAFAKRAPRTESPNPSYRNDIRSPEAKKFLGLDGPPARPLLAAPPEPPPSFGARASSAAGKAWNNVKGVWETIRSAPPEGSAAAKAAEPTRLGNAARAVGRGLVRPLAGLDLMTASGDAHAPTMGQHGDMISPQAAAQLGQTDPGFFRTMMGSPNSKDTDKLLRELNSLRGGMPDQTPEQKAREAQIMGFFKQTPRENKPNPLQFGTIAAPAAPSTQKQSGELMGPPSELATPPDPLKVWQAQALAGMGAGPGSGYKARPDLGAPGEQWLRKGNSYVGVGNGPQRGNGIDFGLPRMAAAGFGVSSGYPEAPEFRENPAVTKLQGQIADAAERLNNIKPGELGGRALARKLVGLQGAMAALQAPSTAQNAFNERRYENEVSKFGAAQTARTQEATNQLARQTAKFNYDVERAKLGNEKHKQALAESQQRLGNENPRLEALAGEDKEMVNSVKLFAGTRQFLGADGKPYSIWDLDPASKAAAYGILQQHVAKAKRLKDAKLPYSLADTDVETPAGVIGSIVSFAHSPIGTVKFGASTINDRLGTAAPRSYTTLEQVEAMKKQEKREQ